MEQHTNDAIDEIRSFFSVQRHAIAEQERAHLSGLILGAFVHPKTDGFVKMDTLWNRLCRAQFLQFLFAQGPSSPLCDVLQRLVSEYPSAILDVVRQCQSSIENFNFEHHLVLARLVSMYVPIEWVLNGIAERCRAEFAVQLVDPHRRRFHSVHASSHDQTGTVAAELFGYAFSALAFIVSALSLRGHEESVRHINAIEQQFEQTLASLKPASAVHPNPPPPPPPALPLSPHHPASSGLPSSFVSDAPAVAVSKNSVALYDDSVLREHIAELQSEVRAMQVDIGELVRRDRMETKQLSGVISSIADCRSDVNRLLAAASELQKANEEAPPKLDSAMVVGRNTRDAPAPSPFPSSLEPRSVGSLARSISLQGAENASMAVVPAVTAATVAIRRQLSPLSSWMSTSQQFLYKMLLYLLSFLFGIPISSTN
eukprot:ANDGO_03569.mRNA.1 hypothetical protein